MKKQIFGITISIITIIYILTSLYFFTSNAGNIVFTIKRPELIEAARKVEVHELRLIKINEEKIRKDSVKKILTPIVVGSN